MTEQTPTPLRERIARWQLRSEFSTTTGRDSRPHAGEFVDGAARPASKTRNWKNGARRKRGKGPQPQLLNCSYWNNDRCRSCALIEQPYPEQLADKQARAEELIESAQWLEPASSAIEVFRNKVKLVVTGTVERPRLGILGPGGKGIDLSHCPLPTPGIQQAIGPIKDFITACDLVPYNPTYDHGLLKYVIISEAPDGGLMVRFVARRRGVQGIIRKLADQLYESLPMLQVLTLNVQPEHKAIIEGEEELTITEAQTLPLDLFLTPGGEPQELHLSLRPQSFFQTNTESAEVLYTRAIEWTAGAKTAWDLYSGVGGFALALAASEAGREVVGVETSEQAVEAARENAPEGATFVVADATEWVTTREDRPDVVIVNPPRRGIGVDLSRWLNESGVERIVYSSCNADSLAQDLAEMENYTVAKGQVVDMFPHTTHFETIVLLEKK